MLSRQASSANAGAGAASSSAGRRHQRQAGGGGGGGAWRCRARTWASMGDLAEADVAPDVTSTAGAGDGTAGGSKGAGVRWASRRRSSTSECSTVDGPAAIEDEDGGRIGSSVQRRRESMRSCLSRESLAAASDGGDTDLADRTNSEVRLAGPPRWCPHSGVSGDARVVQWLLKGCFC